MIIIFIICFLFLAWRYLPWLVAFTIFLLPLYQVRFFVGPIYTNLLELMVVGLVVVWGLKRGQNLFCHSERGRLWRPSRGISGECRNILTRIRERSLGLARDDSSGLGRYLCWPTLLLLFAATLSALVSSNQTQAWIDWRVYFIEPILFFFVIKDLVREEKNRNLFLLAMAGLLGWVGVLTIIQKFTGFLVPPYWFSIARMTGPYSYPNAVGLLVSALVPFVIIMGFTHPVPLPSREGNSSPLRGEDRGGGVFRIFCLLGAVCGIVAVILAQSKGAMLGLAAAGLVGILYYIRKAFDHAQAINYSLSESGRVEGLPKKYWRWWLPVLFIALAVTGYRLQATGFFKLPSPYIFGKIQSVSESMDIRKIVWIETWPMLKDHWFLGAGLAGYQTTMKPYHKALHTEIFMYPHNFIFNIWSELGLLGLLAFGWLVVVFWFGLRGLYPPPQSSPFVKEGGKFLPSATQGGDKEGGWAGRLQATGYRLTILVIFAALIGHGLVDVPYFKNDLALVFWAILAMLI